MGLFHKKSKLKSIVFYTDIDDLPLFNWEKFHKTNNFQWLCELYDEKLIIDKTEAQSNYFKLHDQYREINDDSDKIEEFSTLINLQLEAMVQLIDGDASQINWVTFYDNQIEALTKSGVKQDMIESRMIYQQAYGMAINTKEISLGEYARIVKIVQEQNKPKQIKHEQ